MLKKIILSTTALMLLSACASKPQTLPQQPVIKEPIPQPPIAQEPRPMPRPEPIFVAPPVVESHIFSGETLTATPRVSEMVRTIKNLNHNSAYLDLTGDQNIQLGAFLNISATPNRSGYLKIMIIDPNGERSLVLPNSVHDGYLPANQRFYSNNDNFALKATKPRGLHYVVAIFSEQNARMIMRQGMSGYDAINNDQDFIRILESINNQNYGRSHIALYPIRIY